VNQGPRDEAVIQTPDRRLRVFVSSTLGELAEERRAVAGAITALRLTPVLFEAGADQFDQDFAAGLRLNRQQAIAAVRAPRSTSTSAS
jgi:hypothetical protein